MSRRVNRSKGASAFLRQFPNSTVRNPVYRPWSAVTVTSTAEVEDAFKYAPSPRFDFGGHRHARGEINSWAVGVDCASLQAVGDWKYELPLTVRLTGYAARRGRSSVIGVCGSGAKEIPLLAVMF